MICARAGAPPLEARWSGPGFMFTAPLRSTRLGLRRVMGAPICDPHDADGDDGAPGLHHVGYEGVQADDEPAIHRIRHRPSRHVVRCNPRTS